MKVIIIRNRIIKTIEAVTVVNDDVGEQKLEELRAADKYNKVNITLFGAYTFEWMLKLLDQMNKDYELDLPRDLDRE